MIAGSIALLAYRPVALARSPWMTFQLDMARCLWAILPPALLWGASFPLALAAVAAPGEDSGRLVGEVYAANTLGSIVGALSVSLILVPWIGTQRIADAAHPDSRRERAVPAGSLHLGVQIAGGDGRSSRWLMVAGLLAAKV